MAIAKIVGTDKLSSGFRVKYNNTVDQLISADGTVVGTVIRLPKFGGGYYSVELAGYFATPADVLAMTINYASTSVAGKVRKATEAMVDAGTDNDTYITPYLLAYALQDVQNIQFSYSEDVTAAANEAEIEHNLATEKVDVRFYFADGNPEIEMQWAVVDENTIKIFTTDPANTFTGEVYVVSRESSTLIAQSDVLWRTDGNVFSERKALGTKDGFELGYDFIVNDEIVGGFTDPEPDDDPELNAPSEFFLEAAVQEPEPLEMAVFEPVEGKRLRKARVGQLIPYTAAEIAALVDPPIGWMVYQTDGTEGVYVNKSTGWTLL